MCIIVYKPQGISLDRQTLAQCFQNNPDGAGYMLPCEGRLLIKKGYFTFEDLDNAWAKSRRLHGDELPVVFHFRIATAGAIDKRNCHPHRLTQDLGFVHNGILGNVAVPKGCKVSDTILYRDRYLSRLAGSALGNAKLFRAISRHIGAANKFVFMNGRGKIAICNEEQGVWKDGLWFSNHSFMARRFPLSIFTEEWLCEYCGRPLETPTELVEGACLECLDYFEAGTVGCSGCYAVLPSSAHRELGWCDDCGFAIYGWKWPGMLREAVDTWTTDTISDCF